MNKKSKIYIAGHMGLVGSTILNALAKKKYRNLVYRTKEQLDLANQKETEKFFSKERPEYVFLCAAKVGGIFANSTYKAEFIYDNVMIAANIMQSAFKFGAKKLLNLGSSCIYPKFCPQPMKEEYLLSGSLEQTNEPYAIAKIAAIKMARYFNEQYGTNFISVMPSNLYGPRDNFNLETSHVIPSMIRKYRLARFLAEGNWPAVKKDISSFLLGFGLDGKIDFKQRKEVLDALSSTGISANRVTLWGSGGVYREFLYSEDLASACIFLMEECSYKDIGEFVNIGSGKEIRLKELAQLIRKTAGFKGGTVWDNSKPDGTPRKLLDVSRLKSLGWKSRIDLKRGINLTFAWLNR